MWTFAGIVIVQPRGDVPCESNVVGRNLVVVLEHVYESLARHNEVWQRQAASPQECNEQSTTQSRRNSSAQFLQQNATSVAAILAEARLRRERLRRGSLHMACRADAHASILLA